MTFNLSRDYCDQKKKNNSSCYCLIVNIYSVLNFVTAAISWFGTEIINLSNSVLQNEAK